MLNNKEITRLVEILTQLAAAYGGWSQISETEVAAAIARNIGNQAMLSRVRDRNFDADAAAARAARVVEAARVAGQRLAQEWGVEAEAVVASIYAKIPTLIAMPQPYTAAAAAAIAVPPLNPVA